MLIKLVTVCGCSQMLEMHDPQWIIEIPFYKRRSINIYSTQNDLQEEINIANKTVHTRKFERYPIEDTPTYRVYKEVYYE